MKRRKGGRSGWFVSAPVSSGPPARPGAAASPGLRTDLARKALQRPSATEMGGIPGEERPWYGSPGRSRPWTGRSLRRGMLPSHSSARVMVYRGTSHVVSWAASARLDAAIADATLGVPESEGGAVNIDTLRLSARYRMDFEDAVRESTIPFLVEARDWVRLPERFRREIEREHCGAGGAGTL